MTRRLIGLDHETYYSSAEEYTLRKMDNASYLLDPRFENICVAVKEGHNNAFVVDGPDIPRYFKDLGDPKDITFYGHNLIFDACLNSFRYGWEPGLYFCTLSACRQLIQSKLKSLSLKSVSKYLNLPDKGDEIERVDGMRRNDIIAAGRWGAYCRYAMRDIDNAYDITMWAMPQLPPTEIVIADSVLRMATQPRFYLNEEKLREYHKEIVEEKELSLAKAMVGCGLKGREELMSNDKFAIVLQSLGVDPPQKFSLKKRQMTWAFAKSDEGMVQLAEHDDPVVQAVVAARINHKSTIEETRSARYLKMSRLYYPAFDATGLMPVPLKVSGALTHRLSGDWKLNVQNLKRGGTLRDALEAPEGYAVIAADERQIEARMSATFSEEWGLVEQFAKGLDPYAIMATGIFGFHVTKANIPERYIGKQCVLSGMYGVGGEKFYYNTKAKARDEGIEFNQTLLQCNEIIEKYRQSTPQITQMRSRLHKCIAMMANPDCDFWVGPVRFLHEKILLPSGHYLYYDKLRCDGSQWMFQYAGRWVYLYGGKLLENIIQALARIVVMHALLRMRPRLKQYDCMVNLQAHDELVVVAVLEYVDAVKAIMREEMSRPLPWMPACPIDVEVGVGPTYGSAK